MEALAMMSEYLTIIAWLGSAVVIIAMTLILYRGTKHRKFMLLNLSVLFQVLTVGVFFPLSALAQANYWWLSFLITPAFLFSALFALAQFRLRKYHLRLVRLVRAMVAIGAFVLIIGSFISAIYANALLLLFCWGVTLMMLFVAIWCVRHHLTTARWFGAGWGLVTFALLCMSYWALIAQPVGANEISQIVGLVWVSNLMWFICAISQYIAEKRDKIAKQQTQLSQLKLQEAQYKQQFDDEIQIREELEVKFQERNFELEVTLRELEEKNRELEEKNTQDALTGIRNRRFFDKKYQAEIRRSRREQTNLSIVIVDIDHFKQVNDNYGHLAGDDVIRYVAKALKMTLKRPSDHACRYGGEEFALILPNTDKDGAISLAQSIREQLESVTIDTEAGQIKVTLSCGICTEVAYMDMPDNEYIELADKALYQAKHRGRNRVVHIADCSE